MGNHPVGEHMTSPLGPSQQSYCDKLGWRLCPRPLPFVVQQMKRIDPKKEAA